MRQIMKSVSYTIRVIKALNIQPQEAQALGDPAEAQLRVAARAEADEPHPAVKQHGDRPINRNAARSRGAQGPDAQNSRGPSRRGRRAPSE